MEVNIKIEKQRLAENASARLGGEERLVKAGELFCKGGRSNRNTIFADTADEKHFKLKNF